MIFMFWIIQNKEKRFTFVFKLRKMNQKPPEMSQAI